MPLHIAIVGAGISGLAAAIALSRDGHHVDVYERRASTDEESSSGVQVQPSGVKILRRWGLLEKLGKVAHEAGAIKIFRYENGEMIAEQLRKGPRSQWYSLRNNLRHFLHEAAIASGAAVHFNAHVQTVNLDTPSLTFTDGTTLTADIIVGADGTNSIVRRTMHPGSERIVTKNYVFQTLIPRDIMRASPSTLALYDDRSTRVWLSPSAWSLWSVAPNQNLYDLQILFENFSDTGRDPHPEKLIEQLDNLDMIGDHLDAWDPLYNDTIAKGTKFLKWRLVETPRVPSALARSGRVILIGDAFHGMDPNAGFGSALSLEDGVALAAALRRVESSVDIPSCLRVYDRVQMERSSTIRAYSRALGRVFCTPDGPQQEVRDRKMSSFDPNRIPDAKASAKASYGSAEWQSYMDDYDPEQAVSDAFHDMSQSSQRSAVFTSRL